MARYDAVIAFAKPQPRKQLERLAARAPLAEAGDPRAAEAAANRALNPNQTS